MTAARLAIDGGAPLRSTPLPPWPHYDAEEIGAASAVLASGKVNYWTGTECAEFEREYAAHVGMRYAVALANGSVALELALHALGIGPGDDVVVTCRSFMASASCAVLRGARPVFADVDPVSQNVTAATVEAALTPQTRAVILVHLAGWPCDMDPLLALARSRGVALIEDCAQSQGATYKGRVTGSFGTVTAYSFCQDKIITTGGEGGNARSRRATQHLAPGVGRAGAARGRWSRSSYTNNDRLQAFGRLFAKDSVVQSSWKRGPPTPALAPPRGTPPELGAAKREPTAQSTVRLVLRDCRHDLEQGRCLQRAVGNQIV
jgi:hypothetical protein